ncbi:DUF3784 domain-containing protein [Microbacteriaceae bacterium 4G12]
MIGGFIVCIILGLIIIIMGYQIHIKRRLFLIAGYQKETFTGDKEKLAKTTGFFSYLIGIATFILPFGLERIGTVAGIIYAIVIVLSTILIIILGNITNKPS